MTIKDYLPETEILTQLAEEAAELAQAALKSRRALDGTNPTPVTEDVARAHLLEEFADVNNCMQQLLHSEDYVAVATNQRTKYLRWLKRLEGRDK